MIHYLKTWPEHFESVYNGEKKAELRVNDRDYKVGDTLVLQEYEPEHVEHSYCPGEHDGDKETTYPTRYTGRELKAEVTHVLHGGEFGLAQGHVMMSIDSEIPF